MQLAIHISKHLYDKVLNGNLSETDLEELQKVVKGGKELPNINGKLVDANVINKAMKKRIRLLKDSDSRYEAAVVEVALDMYGATVLKLKKDKED